MRVARLALVLLGVLALGALMRGRLVDALVFQPERGRGPSPAALGVAADPLFLVTEDGVRIHSFWLAAPGADRAVLFLHGNAGSAWHRLENAALLAALGTHVLLLDYRGYGESEGRPSEAGIHADARAGLRHLVTDLGIPERRVVLFGRSLGGAVAVELAVDRSLAGVILESTFSSLADLGRRLFGPPGAWFAQGRFDSMARIRRVRAPLLFFHGDADDIVDPSLGRRLFEGATSPKAFESLRGAGHNDTVGVGGTPYLTRIHRFLDEVAPPEGRSRILAGTNDGRRWNVPDEGG